MKKAKTQQPEQAEPAFVMKDGDRFYSIIASSPIKYDQIPDTETVMVFFVIRRVSGKIDIFHIMKTFKGKNCISRNIQSKRGVPITRIATELEQIQTHFAFGIKNATGITVNWDLLDLSQVQDRDEQVRRIQAWNKVNVYKFPDFSLN